RIIAYPPKGFPRSNTKWISRSLMFRHVYYSFFLLNLLLCPLASLGANPAPTCAESLSTRLASVASTVLPWESDTLGHQWSGRQKYFLIVGVTKLGFASGNNDDF